MTFSENGLCQAMDSLIDQALTLFPKFWNWVFMSGVCDLKYVEIKDYSMGKILKMPGFVIFPQKMNKPIVGGILDNLFSENYYLKSLKKIKKSKAIEIIKEIDLKFIF